jgi:hypothetical protein
MRCRSWRPLANFRRARAFGGGDLRRPKKAVRIRTRIFVVRGHSVTLRRGEPEPAGRFLLASYPNGIGFKIRSTARGPNQIKKSCA